MLNKELSTNKILVFLYDRINIKTYRTRIDFDYSHIMPNKSYVLKERDKNYKVNSFFPLREHIDDDGYFKICIKLHLK